MQRATPEEPITLSAGALRIDGRIAVPPAARHGVVFSHPHPQYGGTMDNDVVVGATLALRQAGIATIRFNFRGVGRSEGAYSGDNRWGEVEDARAAASALAERLPRSSLVQAGYSFGAMVALLAGHDDRRVGRLAAVALPATMFDTSFLEGSAKPLLFLHGDRDQYCAIASLEALMLRFGAAARLVRLAGADHFSLDPARFGEELVRFVLASPPTGERPPQSGG